MKLDTIPITSIEVGKRFREEFGDIEELAQDISKRGLISPLAVKALPGGKYLLLAGERRFRALQQNNSETVPVRIYEEDLSDLEVRAIELSENFYRKDLEWSEYVKLTKEIHLLQQSIHGEKISTSPDADGWSTRDTAALIGKSQTSVVRDLKLANAVEAAPEVFSECKTAHEATKLLKKLEEQKIREELARRVTQAPSDTVRKQLADAYILRDAIEAMQELPAESVHLVEIDPPYAINLTKAKKDYTYSDSYNEIRKEDYLKFLRSLLKASFRVMAPHSWLILWFAHEPWFEPTYALLREVGFEGDRMVGVWKKPTGQSNQPQIHLANCTEFFFYARKGSPVLASPGRPNVFEVPPVPPSHKVHPTERPIELLQEILGTFGFEGQRVLVPCCGSGNTLLAAHTLGMTPLGFDLSKEYKDSYVVKVFQSF